MVRMIGQLQAILNPAGALTGWPVAQNMNTGGL